MNTINIHRLELSEFTGMTDPDQHCRATFPLFGAHGTRQSATVYFELDAGKRLGRHTDSAEEILLILEGEVEATVGETTGQFKVGDLVLIPVMEPHDVRNIGTGMARVLGFFGGASQIVSTFDETWLPVESNVVDTAQLVG